MLTKIFTASTLGLQAQLIEVEIDLSHSLPGIVVVGLPDKAVQESKERIRAALKQSGFEFPVGKITVNLAPADIIKTGTGFDLAIAIGILQLTGLLPNFAAKTLFVGELALDGRIRSVTGLLTICLWARRHGWEQVFLPIENQSEVSLVSNLTIFTPKTLTEIVQHLQGTKLLEPVEPINLAQHLTGQKNLENFSNFKKRTNQDDSAKESHQDSTKLISHTKTAKTDKNLNQIAKLQKLLDHFEPDSLKQILAKIGTGP